MLHGMGRKSFDQSWDFIELKWFAFLAIYTRAPTCRVHGGNRPAVHCSRLAFREFCSVHFEEKDTNGKGKKEEQQID